MQRINTLVQPIFVATLAALAVTLAAAQLPSAAPPAAPPLLATIHNPIPSSQLDFVNAYNGKQAKDLLGNKRYKALMGQIVPQSTFHYGVDMSLADAVGRVMKGSKQPVTIVNGRYATIAGGTGPYLRGRGVVWMDLQAGTVLGAVYFHPTNGEPSPTLTVYSRQLNDTNLSMGQLPAAFAGSLEQWTRSVGAPLVSARYFIPVDGKKYVLVHDEDYCGNASAQSPLEASACKVLTEHAAETDLAAAYFMADAQNAANATAWTTRREQVVWLAGLNRSCGPAMGCRISGIRAQVLLMGRCGCRR